MRLSSLQFMLVLLLSATLASGCVVEVEEVAEDLPGDIQVNWNYKGDNVDPSTDPSICDQLGIERWEVVLLGPGADRLNEVDETILVDCREDDWTTGNFYFRIFEGLYVAQVTALGADDTVISQTVEETIQTPGVAIPDTVELSFFPEHFAP